MRSEFDFGEVVDSVDMLNAYGVSNNTPPDPLADNVIGVGMPVVRSRGMGEVSAEAAKKAANMKLLFLAIAVIVILYLVYKRGEDKSNPRRVRLNPEPEIEPEIEDEPEIEEGEEDAEDDDNAGE